MMAGLWDDISSGVMKTVDAAQGEVKAMILRFSKSKTAAEKNYASLIAQNNYRKANKILFANEAERAKFQTLLDDGRLAVNSARKVGQALVLALRTVNADPKEYGLGYVQFIIPVAVAVALYASVKLLESFVNRSAPAVTQEALIKQGVAPAEAAKLSNEALTAKAAADKAQADLNKNTFDRIMDNLPVLAGGAAALVFLPKLLELLPKPKRAAA